MTQSPVYFQYQSQCENDRCLMIAASQFVELVLSVRCCRDDHGAMEGRDSCELSVSGFNEKTISHRFPSYKSSYLRMIGDTHFD